MSARASSVSPSRPPPELAAPGQVLAGRYRLDRPIDADPDGELWQADDIVLMVPNEPVQEGRLACAAFVRRVLAEQAAWFDRLITYVSEEVTIRGELAFDRGSFSFTTVARHDGSKSSATGKYLWLYTAGADGQWKLARAIMSLDDPPEGS